MLYSVKKDVTEDIMALNIAVPLSGVGGLSPTSPLGIDCWQNIKILVSPIGSESSGISSLDSDDAKLTPPKSPEDLKIMYNGRDVLDLYANIAPNPKLWNLRYTHLPKNNLQMFLANRSQYHRLGENSHILDYTLVKCEDCDFQYPVDRTNSLFCQTSVNVSHTTNTTMTYTKSGLAPTVSSTSSASTITSSAAVGSNKYNNYQFSQKQQLQQFQSSSLMPNKQQQISSTNFNYQNANNSSENFLNNVFAKRTTTASSTPIKMPPSMPPSTATSPTSSGYSGSNSSIASVGLIGKYQLNGAMINNNNTNGNNCTKNINPVSNSANNNVNTFHSFLNSINNGFNANNISNNNNGFNAVQNNLNPNYTSNSNNSIYINNHNNQNALLNSQQPNYSRMYKYF